MSDSDFVVQVVDGDVFITVRVLGAAHRLDSDSSAMVAEIVVQGLVKLAGGG